MSTIRVVLADPQPLVRRGFRSLLGTTPDIELVAEVGDGASAQNAVLRLHPDILITELKLPCLARLDLVRHLARQAPQTKTIILTGYHQDDLIFEALREGVYAYLLKDADDSSLLEALRLVAQGKRLLSPALVDTVLHQFQFLAQAQVRNAYNLTSHDLTLLRLLSQGVSSAQIAVEMHWSERTVKRRMDEIMSKLSAENRTHMVAEAVRRGLV